MSKPQRQKAVDQICSGKAAVVLVSPEALVGGSSAVGCLPHPSKLPPIAFACIDEAHCVSEWSHNFRPSYLRVCKVCVHILRLKIHSLFLIVSIPYIFHMTYIVICLEALPFYERQTQTIVYSLFYL